MLRWLFRNPDTGFSVVGFSKLVQAKQAEVRKEISSFKEAGIVKVRRVTIASKSSGSKKNGIRYVLNVDFDLFNELRDLVLKSSPAEKSKMITKMNNLGLMRLSIISGIFIEKQVPDSPSLDLFLVVDDLDRRKLRIFLKWLEAEAGKEIKYAVMDKEEFLYRLGMFDRFIRVLLEGPHEKLVDKIGLDVHLNN